MRCRFLLSACVLLLLLAIVLVSTVLLSGSRLTALAAVHGTPHIRFLPIVHRTNGSPPPTQTPPPPTDLLILDQFGQQRDWDWVTSKFGAVTLERGNGAATVRVLEEREGPMALIAHVEQDGHVMVNYPVMFYWPDAPALDPAYRACGKDQALIVYTKENGNAELIMGGGSDYNPQTETGAYTVWVGGPGSDCLAGLGWLMATNHVHLDSRWELP